MGLENRKTFGVASFHAGQFTLLVDQIDIFFLFVYMMETLILTLQLNQTVFYRLSLTTREVNHQPRHTVSEIEHQNTWRTKGSTNSGICISLHTQTKSLNLERQTLSLSHGMTKL
jgi:hypothetical protein